MVIYSSGEESFSHAAYVAFVLNWLGHRAIGVLDGGFEKWRAEDREITLAFPSHARAEFEARPDSELLKTRQEVMDAISGESAVLLDARRPEQYESGHIPTARSFFLQNTLEGDTVKTWKSPEELRALASEAGVRADRPTITYCTSGRESAQIWFTLRYVAGLEDVSSYHGSWIDWTAAGLPAESGCPSRP